MRRYMTCKYCDYKWQGDIEICLKCKDTNIRIQHIEDVKIDYYIGCPPFITSKTIKNQSLNEMYIDQDWNFL